MIWKKQAKTKMIVRTKTKQIGFLLSCEDDYV